MQTFSCFGWKAGSLITWVKTLYKLRLNIARNLGHETPRFVTRGNLKTDRDAEVYRDLYGHSRKMANISLRLKENKNVQLNYNRLLYYGANYVKITTK